MLKILFVLGIVAVSWLGTNGDPGETFNSIAARLNPDRDVSIKFSKAAI